MDAKHPTLLCGTLQAEVHRMNNTHKHTWVSKHAPITHTHIQTHTVLFAVFRPSGACLLSGCFLSGILYPPQNSHCRTKLGHAASMCVCVCVCERERERAEGCRNWCFYVTCLIKHVSVGGQSRTVCVEQVYRECGGQGGVELSINPYPPPTHTHTPD